MNRILTTHTGSLIRPPEVLAILDAIERGEVVDEAARAHTIRASSRTTPTSSSIPNWLPIG